MINKRGYYYSVDALIAVIIIFFVILSLRPRIEKPELPIKIHEDLIFVLSDIRVGEINDSYFSYLIESGQASPRNTLLEQLVEFYAKDSPHAELMLNHLLSGINLSYNIGVWIENKKIYSSNFTPYSLTSEVLTARQFVSGLKKSEGGEEVRGFSSRAYLTSPYHTDYYYFGGYFGEGNISIRIDYNGSLKDIKLEIATSKDFDIYINNLYSGHYEKSPSELSPSKYPLDAYKSNFRSGSNIITFSSSDLYIAGGFIKIIYESNSPYSINTKKYLPGISGLINIYDSIYFPSNFTSIDVFLHYTSPVNVSFILGNTIIYESNGTNVSRLLSSSEIFSKISQLSLINKNIPFRIKISNVTYIGNVSLSSDIVSVTDLSGSMNDCSHLYTCSYRCLIGGSKSCQTYSQCSSHICGGTCLFPYDFS
ncbi:MAG: hypothetical protein QXJ28_03415, partial [Candidatus Pacearchaeota archaeon]